MDKTESGTFRMPLPPTPDLQAQMEHLLAVLYEQGTRHLAEAESDLHQTAALLEEAIRMLAASFMRLHMAVSAQQEQMAALLGSGHTGPESHERFHDSSVAVELHINTAVTGLQFQDLTNQLIDRTVQRLAGVRAMLAGAGNAARTIASTDRNGLEAIHVQAASLSLLEQSSMLEEALRKSVRQSHMKSGEVELF